MGDKPGAVIATAAPRTDKSGRAMLGDYPFNHRLRAEALSAAGVEKDPDGVVTPAAIVAAGARVAALEAAKVDALDLTGKRKAELEEIAALESVDLAGAKNNDERASLIEKARAAKAEADAAAEAERLAAESATSGTGEPGAGNEEG